MEDRRRCTTVRQLELMVQFLDENRDLALGRVKSKEARAVAARLWRECADTLNAEGPARTGKEWSKVWNDYKCRVRAKLVSINANQRATGGGASNAPRLSQLEERTANILGRDIGPLANVRQDQFASIDGDGVAVDLVAEQPQSVHDCETPSAILLNMDAADQLHIQADEPEYVLSATSPVHVQPLPVSPVPSVTGQAPSLQGTPRRTAERVRRVREYQRRRIERPPRQLTTQTVTQSTKSALEDSRAMILNIEELRAQAALKNAEAVCNFSDSFRLIAESIDRCSQMYCLQQSHQNLSQ